VRYFFKIGIPDHILTSLFTSVVITVIIGQMDEIMEESAIAKLLSKLEIGSLRHGRRQINHRAKIK
jgi:hypothetical protein